MAVALLALVALAYAGEPTSGQDDPRCDYDVRAYHLELRVDPVERRLQGKVTIQLAVDEDGLRVLRLDLADDLRVERVSIAEGALGTKPSRTKALYFEHEGETLDCHLVRPARKGRRLLLAVHYRGSPGAIGRSKGISWRTPEGEPRVDASLQNVGAHHWFPCKTSLHHPEDRSERTWVDLEVPEGFRGISNGRYDGSEDAGDGWTRWRWRHDYPLPTYGVALNVGRYEMLEERLTLPELEGTVPFLAFVAPAHVERARVQFAEVPDMLAVYTRAFGPWPFPTSKVALVEASFLAADHATAMGYGSTYPSWMENEGLRDPRADINHGYDFVLAHQLAHEWWGNSVAAASWRDYWLHEGFATYAESLWVEHLGGRERSDAFFRERAKKISPTSRLVPRERNVDAVRAFNRAIYDKGAWVLNLARHELGDDELWWSALRSFQARHRHGSATTHDLRRVLEDVSGRDWRTFFDEWVFGEGYPRLEGRVIARDDHIEVDVENSTAEGRSFHVVVDLAWNEAGETVTHRVSLVPGPNSITIPCLGRPAKLEVRHLERILGHHSIAVEDQRSLR